MENIPGMAESFILSCEYSSHAVTGGRKSSLAKLSRNFRNLKLKLTGEGTSHADSDDNDDEDVSSFPEPSMWFVKGLEEELTTQEPASPRNPGTPINAAQPGPAMPHLAPRKPKLTIDTKLASYRKTSSSSPTRSQCPPPAQQQPFDLNEWLQRPPTPIPIPDSVPVPARPVQNSASPHPVTGWYGNSALDSAIQRGIKPPPLSLAQGQEVFAKPSSPPWMAVPGEFNQKEAW